MPRLKQSSEDSDIGVFWMSDAAEDQFSKLSDFEQIKLLDGLAKVYGRTLSKLFDINMQTFSEVRDFQFLSLVSNDKTTFAIEGYAVRVEICAETFDWSIVSIGLPGSLEKFEVRKI